MNDLIKVKNSGYSEYEELLFERDKVKKEASEYNLEFLREFGDTITEIFRLKIECISKKKSISFIQARVNKGEDVDSAELEDYLATEMAEYQEKLSQLIDDNVRANSGDFISPRTAEKIKKLYHKLAKMIHPDINPKTDEVEALKNIWQMIKAAYTNNNLDELEEAEVLLNHALNELGMGSEEIEIPDIEDKIQKLKDEIFRIKTENPYSYRYILEDPEALETKKTELAAELKEYQEYSASLDAILEELMSNGVKFTWLMN